MHSRPSSHAVLPALLLLAGCFLPAALPAHGAGVTLITHGYSGNVTDWVIPMANKIPRYGSFPGTNVSAYEISITKSGSTYNISQTFLDGESPLVSDSGEITVALDWSTLSGLSPVTATTTIAAQVAAALLSTNLIPDLHGHALAELPLHLVGHSRGASVVTEVARILGAQGLWVDHVTTLDPYPVGLLGDPSMKNYANILFADNYWQTLGSPSGQALGGAYNRQLTSLSGGYSGTSATHSDVHLWYHGTLDLVTPTSDTQASITNGMRTTWWTALEAAGTNAGFLYSRIGGGNRLSSLEPAGAGNGRISDGMNKVWNLGAGVAANRNSLPTDNGAWPNIIRLDLAVTSPVTVGQPVAFSVYHQFGSNTLASATLRLYLDPDANPYNGNETVVLQGSLAGTGTNTVTLSSASFSPNPSTTLPGTYAVFAQISAGPYTRYLYAPQPLVLTPSQQAPVLVGPQFAGNQFYCTVFGLPGQKVIVQGSTNLVQWASLRTNTLGVSASVPFSDPASGRIERRFYRAVLSP